RDGRRRLVCATRTRLRCSQHEDAANGHEPAQGRPSQIPLLFCVSPLGHVSELTPTTSEKVGNNATRRGSFVKATARRAGLAWPPACGTSHLRPVVRCGRSVPSL